jgi:hypothetical protein
MSSKGSQLEVETVGVVFDRHRAVAVRSTVGGLKRSPADF